MAKTKREIDHDDLHRPDEKYKRLVVPKKPKTPRIKKKSDVPIRMDKPGAAGPMVTGGKLRRNRKDGHVNGEGKCD